MTTTKRKVKTASGTVPAVEGGAQQMHDVVTWLDIHADGSEMRRSGRIWEHAPALTGAGKAWWVIPDEQVGDEPSAVLVVRAGRRHQVGRPRRHPTREGAEVWDRKGGRYVDKGEYYRETDPRSRVAHVENGGALVRHWSLPGLVGADSVEVTNYEAWLRICEARADRAAAAATATKGE
jgi:hypothetical protein